jgi:hypothetical protein
MRSEKGMSAVLPMGFRRGEGVDGNPHGGTIFIHQEDFIRDAAAIAPVKYGCVAGTPVVLVFEFYGSNPYGV